MIGYSDCCSPGSWQFLYVKHTLGPEAGETSFSQAGGIECFPCDVIRQQGVLCTALSVGNVGPPSSPLLSLSTGIASQPGCIVDIVVSIVDSRVHEVCEPVSECDGVRLSVTSAYDYVVILNCRIMGV